MAPTSRFNLGSTISSWSPSLHTRNTLRSRLIEKVHCVECLGIIKASHPFTSHWQGGRQSYHQLLPAVHFVELSDSWGPSDVAQGISRKDQLDQLEVPRVYAHSTLASTSLRTLPAIPLRYILLVAAPLDTQWECSIAEPKRLNKHPGHSQNTRDKPWTNHDQKKNTKTGHAWAAKSMLPKVLCLASIRSA